MNKRQKYCTILHSFKVDSSVLLKNYAGYPGTELFDVDNFRFKLLQLKYTAMC